MQELDKMVEEICENAFFMDDDLVKEKNRDENELYISFSKLKKIIFSYLMHDDGWIPVEKELPPNAKHKGALCPRYQLNTKYGVTEGWYNPDLESWFVLVWFQTERYLKSEIDFEKGSHPKIVRCGNKVNDRDSIVTDWRPLPESNRPEHTTQRPEWKDRMLHTFLGGHEKGDNRVNV